MIHYSSKFKLYILFFKVWLMVTIFATVYPILSKIILGEDFSSAAVSLEPVWQHMTQYELSGLQQAADYCAEWKRSKPHPSSPPRLLPSISTPASMATPSRPATLPRPMEIPRALSYSGTSLPGNCLLEFVIVFLIQRWIVIPLPFRLYS